MCVCVCTIEVKTATTSRSAWRTAKSGKTCTNSIPATSNINDSFNASYVPALLEEIATGKGISVSVKEESQYVNTRALFFVKCTCVPKMF